MNLNFMKLMSAVTLGLKSINTFCFAGTSASIHALEFVALMLNAVC